jgi:hypothetical protein
MRVEREVLGPRDNVRYGLRYLWNRKVDEVLSPNSAGRIVRGWFALPKYTQVVGGCAVYIGGYWYRCILARVDGQVFNGPVR